MRIIFFKIKKLVAAVYNKVKKTSLFDLKYKKTMQVLLTSLPTFINNLLKQVLININNVFFAIL